PAKLAEGSIVREVYDDKEYVEERHRHRYEVNNAYRAELEKKAGIVFSGTSPDGKLVEDVEDPRDGHRYRVATRAAPERRPRPRPQPPTVEGPCTGAVERKSSKSPARWYGCRGANLQKARTPAPFSRRAHARPPYVGKDTHDDQGHPGTVGGPGDRDPLRGQQDLRAHRRRGHARRDRGRP